MPYAGALMGCQNCDAIVPVGARFCPSCGAAQQASPSQPEERRIVTVLFADLVGFTTLSEHLDPEQVKRLIDSCFERMVTVIADFGGRVDKLLGDGMLALFGAPVAHEDDAERAVRAAIRMHEVLASVVGNDLQMRIGIMTGEVLVGTLAGTDYTAMGDVVNTASRLQSAAPPGGVLVGPATHALTEHTVRYSSAGSLQPRGREQSLDAWLALGVDAPPGARRRHHDIELVGRTAEMAMATTALEHALAHGTGMVLHVNGDTGVGKSRLVDEILGRARDLGAVVVEGACAPYGETGAWWPVMAALAGDSPDDALDPRDAAAARQIALTEIERRLDDAAVVLSIDDLQWSDPALVELLDALTATLSRRPFVVVTATRPGTELEWPPRSDRGLVLSLTLAPLERSESDAVVRQLLDSQQPDEGLLAQLHDRSGGNPLFLVELAALTASGGQGAELPDSLRSLIAARLDQLGLELRHLLENASVLGTSGTVESLIRFGEALGEPVTDAHLDELDDLGLLRIAGRRWEFRSDAVRDAAYQTLTKLARVHRHLGVATAMAGKAALADDRAHHMAAAAELVQELGTAPGVPVGLAAEAVQLLTVSAERALDSGGLRAASSLARRALDLMDPDERRSRPAEVARLHLVRASAAIERRNQPAATADLDELERITDQLDDAPLRAEYHRLRGMLANVAGRADTARSELGIAIDILRGTPRRDLLARTLRVRGFIEMFTGSLTDAEWFFGEADGLFRELDDERGMALVEQNRAWISFLSGDLALARARLTSAATTLGRLDDRNGVGWALGLLAFIEFFERNTEQAELLASTVTEEARRRGDDWAMSMMDTLLANIRMWQGRIADAHDLAERALATFRRLGDRFGAVQALSPLLRAQVALGRHAAAQRSSEELSTLAEGGRLGPIPLLSVAGAAMHRGAPAIAVAAAERAIDEMRGAASETDEPLVVLAAALTQAGRHEEALATISRAPHYGGTNPFTNSVAALVHCFHGDHDEALELAARALSTSGVSYLDTVIAHVAIAGAQQATGHTAAAHQAALDAAARARAAGDVTMLGVAGLLIESLGGTRPDDAVAEPGDGWRTVVAELVSRRGRDATEVPTGTSTQLGAGPSRG